MPLRLCKLGDPYTKAYLSSSLSIALTRSSRIYGEEEARLLILLCHEIISALRLRYDSLALILFQPLREN